MVLDCLRELGALTDGGAGVFHEAAGALEGGAVLAVDESIEEAADFGEDDNHEHGGVHTPGAAAAGEGVEVAFGGAGASAPTAVRAFGLRGR